MNDVPQEDRLRRFVGFFKGYMGVMPLLTAAVAPLLTAMKTMPIFESHKSVLATYSGLLGFLLLAYVFYLRGPLAKAMVPHAPGSRFTAFAVNMIPLLLMAGSIFCYVSYSRALDQSIAKARESARSEYSDIVSRREVLEKWGQREEVYRSQYLQYNYLGIFLLAECAFVVMALREYAHGVLKLTEAQILRGTATSFLSKPEDKIADS
jgi:hypothetical protein